MKKALLSLAGWSFLTAALLTGTAGPAAGAAEAGKGDAAAEEGISFRMKRITVSLGGFLEAAAIYRSRNLNSDLPSPFQKLPLANAPGYYQDETRFTARQSRLSLLVKGDVNEETHLAGYYEMDFLGAAGTANSNESNSFNPRMRNVYITADWDRGGVHLLAGQNWSLVTLTSEGLTPRKEVIPSGVDSQYVPGFSWVRQPQFRFVKDWDRKYWLGLSVENAQTLVQSGQQNADLIGANFAVNQPGGGALTNVTTSVNPYPDFVVKAAGDFGWGHLELFDLVRVFESSLGSGGRVKNTFAVTNAVGGGVIVRLIPKVKLQLSGMYGKGVGRYGTAQLPDVTQNQAGENIPLTGSQLLAGVNYDPSKAWTFYAYYGEERMHRKSFVDPAGRPFGYGSELYDNSGATTLGKKVFGNIRKVWQVTGGFWWKFYQGEMGKMQVGVQYSFTEDDYFHAISGDSPTANDHILFTSLRYYWE